MNRKYAAAAGIAVVATLSLAACSGGTGAGASPSATADKKPVTISISGWTLGTSPEFQTLADGFHQLHPNVTVEVKGYDAAQYTTLLTADLAAGTAPDVIAIKQVTDMVTFASGGQLADVSDVKLTNGLKGVDSYKFEGKQYAVPYRIDGNVLFYNKDLFKAAGVPEPDGTWTWDDYTAAAEKLKTGLKSAGSSALPAYLHTWNSQVQGFATAQTPKASMNSGNYAYMKPYYDQALKMQTDGLQLPYATATATKATYQAQFGKQQAAMLLMGTWYVSALIGQQKTGDAQTFAWGMAPVPQRTSATAGKDKTPVTFGDPTGYAINIKTDGAKLAAAKEFLSYIETEQAALALTKDGITPALTTDAVVKSYFSQPGVPTDALSKLAWGGQKIAGQNPPAAKTPIAQTALTPMHSAIMTGSSSIDKGIADAEAQFKNQAG